MTSILFNTSNIRWTDLDDDDIRPVLTTRVVPIENWKNIRLLVDDWLLLANKRYVTADLTRYSGKLPNYIEIAKLETSSKILNAIQLHLAPTQDPYEEYVEWDSLLVCEDTNTKIQAIALVQIDQLKIVFIATHPDNIISSLRNNEVSPVRGAGSQIIHFLALKALKSNKILRIETTEDAERFYIKLGFSRVAPKHSMWLQLTPDKIQEMITKKIKPFNQINACNQKC